MHYSTIILSLCATLAIASPSSKGYKDWKEDLKEKAEWKKDNKLFYLDEYVKAKATPDQVIANNGTAVPGQPGAKGIFKYGLNLAENTICYNITLSGVTGEYSSPANTATHIHEGVKGKPGPPRIALPNPTGPDSRRTSYGCLKGPFKTGIVNNGVDTGAGFHVSQIAKNPEGFFTDSHTVAFIAGAVRGQLSEFDVKKW